MIRWISFALGALLLAACSSTAEPTPSSESIDTAATGGDLIVRSPVRLDHDTARRIGAVEGVDLVSAERFVEVWTSGASHEDQIVFAAIEPDNRGRIAQAQVDQAEASLKSAPIRLEHGRLKAPFSGTVISLEAEPGEVIAAGTPVVVLADTSRWYVETLDVLEEAAVRLRPGQPAAAEFAAYPDRELAGRVDQVALNASTHRGNGTYTVRISLPAEPKLELSWGMTAFVEIQPAVEPSAGALTSTPSLTPSPTPAPLQLRRPPPAPHRPVHPRRSSTLWPKGKTCSASACATVSPPKPSGRRTIWRTTSFTSASGW